MSQGMQVVWTVATIASSSKGGYLLTIYLLLSIRKRIAALHIRSTGYFMIETYLREIQQLITENQTVKNHNRKLSVLSAELIGQVIDLFKQNFDSIEPYAEPELDKALEGLIEYYRQALMKVKMDLKMKITEFLIQFDFQIDYEIGSITLDTWKEFFSATRSSSSLKQKISQVQKQKQQLELNVKEVENTVHELNLQITRLKAEIIQKQNERDKIADSNVMLKLDLDSLRNQLIKITSRYGILESDFKLMEAEVSSLVVANTEMRRQILRNQRDKNVLDSDR